MHFAKKTFSIAVALPARTKRPNFKPVSGTLGDFFFARTCKQKADLIGWLCRQCLSPINQVAFFSVRAHKFAYKTGFNLSLMADCDWVRSTFSGPLLSRNRSAVHYEKTKFNIAKLNVIYFQFNLLLISNPQVVFSEKEGIGWYFFVFFEQHAIPY